MRSKCLGFNNKSQSPLRRIWSYFRNIRTRWSNTSDQSHNKAVSKRSPKWPCIKRDYWTPSPAARFDWPFLVHWGRHSPRPEINFNVRSWLDYKLMQYSSNFLILLPLWPAADELSVEYQKISPSYVHQPNYNQITHIISSQTVQIKSTNHLRQPVPCRG